VIVNLLTDGLITVVTVAIAATSIAVTIAKKTDAASGVHSTPMKATFTSTSKRRSRREGKC